LDENLVIQEDIDSDSGLVAHSPTFSVSSITFSSVNDLKKNNAIKFADNEKEIVCGYKDIKEKESWLIEIKGCFERFRRSNQSKVLTPNGQMGGPIFADLIQAMTQRTKAVAASYESNGTTSIPSRFPSNSPIISPPLSTPTSSIVPSSSSIPTPIITPPPLPSSYIKRNSIHGMNCSRQLKK